MTNVITAALLLAMANVESGGNSRSIGDHGKARGHLQIHRCAIQDAWDAERRQGVKSFTLSGPTADVTIASGELPVLGTITWPT